MPSTFILRRLPNVMAAGVTDRLWSVEDSVARCEAYEQRRAERAGYVRYLFEFILRFLLAILAVGVCVGGILFLAAWGISLSQGSHWRCYFFRFSAVRDASGTDCRWCVLRGYFSWQAGFKVAHNQAEGSSALAAAPLI